MHFLKRPHCFAAVAQLAVLLLNMRLQDQLNLDSGSYSPMSLSSLAACLMLHLECALVDLLSICEHVYKISIALLLLETGWAVAACRGV